MAANPPPTSPLEKLEAALAEKKISTEAADNIRRWLSSEAFVAYRKDLAAAVDAGQWKPLEDAFYKVLEFGTGGRRGLMAPLGTNVLNERTMAESARGLADFLLKKHAGENRRLSVVVAHDTRHNSPEFARVCARAIAAAGLDVHLFDSFRSTPLLSFAVRHLHCDAGIMITASHNPPSDNGFKCYNGKGGQVVPPDDAAIIAAVVASAEQPIPLADYEEALSAGTIKIAPVSVDHAYLKAVLGESVTPERNLSVVYTPMHGVGGTSVGEALKMAGFSSVNLLAAQSVPDPNFTTIPGHVANPEIPKTLEAAIAEAKATGADLVLASDPDADRIGAAVPVNGDPAGEWITLDGNSIGVILAAFVLERTRDAGKLKPEHYLVSTLVSTPMAPAIYRKAGLRVVNDLLVGFKWIAAAMDDEGPENFLFGFEESHGYLKGTYARDKDATVAAMLFAEAAAWLKANGRTVVEYLDSLYLQVGHYGQAAFNLTLSGRDGAALIQKIMASFRTTPPTKVAGLDMVRVDDYAKHVTKILKPSPAEKPLPEPSGDLLMYTLDAPDVRFAVRPSGTEPKIKFYLFARTEVPAGSSAVELPAIKAKTAGLLKALEDDLRQAADAIVAS
jgi:phosphoglucomutase/phosphomannomutase